ncbi:MAG: hypothetical protein HN919_01525 [Verrucomicrobia bacterium]|nr:hypothetical protein [Verrucomicrobiota bacterium]MBT7064957.1 hypothetical protein [Verrucomicrobiota bacterium]MBT7702064.1 hypothetical protein [Verrucomicrobiota bacterium]
MLSAESVIAKMVPARFITQQQFARGAAGRYSGWQKREGQGDSPVTQPLPRRMMETLKRTHR